MKDVNKINEEQLEEVTGGIKRGIEAVNPLKTGEHTIAVNPLKTGEAGIAVNPIKFRESVLPDDESDPLLARKAAGRKKTTFQNV